MSYMKNREVRIMGIGLILGLCCLVSQSCLAVPAGGAGKTAFTVQQDAAGKYWFTDGEGKRFLSIGINDILPEPRWPKAGSDYYNPVPSQYGGDFDAWKKDVYRLLQDHGFNTVGAWSDGRLCGGPVYSTVCLYVAAYADDRCLDGLRPGFEDRIRRNVKRTLEAYPTMDNVLGVFLDNEMPWYGHAPWGDIPNYTLLEKALSLPAEDEARKAAIGFLQKRYGSVEAFAAAWGHAVDSWDAVSFEYARGCINERTQADREAFIGIAAEAFYQTACRVVREMLPGELILGTLRCWPAFGSGAGRSR